MTPRVSAILTSVGILAYIDGQAETVTTDHPNYKAIDNAVRTGRYDLLPDLMNIRKATAKWVSSKSGDFILDKNDCISLNGKPFTPTITNLVLDMIERGHTPEPLYNFLRKVRQNVSAVAQEELLLFVEASMQDGGMAIHEDGDILAYKSIRNDYTDLYSGKVTVRPGTPIKRLDRQDVDDNRERTCSYGYHFATYTYATTWHGASDARLIIMKINPADVVTIPSDYSNQKARCAYYVAYAEIPHGTRLDDSKRVFGCRDFDSETTRSERAEKINALRQERDAFVANLTDAKTQLKRLERLLSNAADAGADDDVFEALERQIDELNIVVAEYEGEIAALDEELGNL